MNLYQGYALSLPVQLLSDADDEESNSHCDYVSGEDEATAHDPSKKLASPTHTRKKKKKRKKSKHQQSKEDDPDQVLLITVIGDLS